MGEDSQDGQDPLASTEAQPSVTFASVTANGTGCPAGTWKGVPSADGKHYSLKFESFDPRVDQEKSVSIENCQLGIALNTPEDSSVALESVKLGGWISLSRGTSALIQTKAYFQGDPTKASETKQEYTGARISRLGTIKHDADALVWSPCGKERNLNLNTVVRVKGDGEHRGVVRIDELENIKIAVKKCGDEGGEKPDEGGEKPDEGGEKPGPDAPAIVSVSANGTGCPAGTSTVTIRPDGLSARIDYSAFLTEVDETSAHSSKNCQLGIVLQNMDKFQYSVSNTVDGYALLAPGQSAKILQKAYNQGNPSVDTEEASSVIQGAFDDLFKVQVLGEHVTKCGTTRNVNLNTVVSLTNAPERKDGLVDINAKDGKLTSGQSITVTAKPCN